MRKRKAAIRHVLFGFTMPANRGCELSCWMPNIQLRGALLLPFVLSSMCDILASIFFQQAGNPHTDENMNTQSSGFCCGKWKSGLWQKMEVSKCPQINAFFHCKNAFTFFATEKRTVKSHTQKGTTVKRLTWIPDFQKTTFVSMTGQTSGDGSVVLTTACGCSWWHCRAVSLRRGEAVLAAGCQLTDCSAARLCPQDSFNQAYDNCGQNRQIFSALVETEERP